MKLPPTSALRPTWASRSSPGSSQPRRQRPPANPRAQEPRGARRGGRQASPDGPSGTDYIYNDRYQQIATVRAGNGDATNFHEFLITPWNTALITADTVTTANLTSIGGPADQRVIDGLVQEVDIRTGRVLFQWDSAAHVPYADSYVARPSSPSTPWDWFHINAVHLDTDGNLLVSSRNTWTVFKVDRHTGQIMWQLGGKHSSFTLRAAPGQVLDRDGKIFAWQHDPEAIGGGEYTFFDDESGGNLLGSSRVVTVRLDLATRVATLVKSDDQPEGQVAQLMGNAQTTPGGDLFVGWGALPYISEFSPSGKLLFNAELPAGVSTYRAYLLLLEPPRLIIPRLLHRHDAACGAQPRSLTVRTVSRPSAGLERGPLTARQDATGRRAPAPPCPAPYGTSRGATAVLVPVRRRRHRSTASVSCSA